MVKKERLKQWATVFSKKYDIDFTDIDNVIDIEYSRFQRIKNEMYSYIILYKNVINTIEMIQFKHWYTDIIDFIKLDAYLESELLFKGIYPHRLSGVEKSKLVLKPKEFKILNKVLSTL